jgi:hypothetical protein
MNKAAQSLGRLGGLAKSAAKTAAVRENGKLGGRPKKKKRVARRPNEKVSDASDAFAAPSCSAVRSTAYKQSEEK